MHESVYQKLADHLDKLPGGFAPSHTGAELRLLRRLFTPEEAELAVHLTLDREEARSIADRAALPPVETEQRLAEMARKGLIYSVHPEDGSPLYLAAPFVIGIYEFQVNNLSEDLLRDLDDYWSTQKKAKPVRTIRQMRTIPIDQSIEPHLEAFPYNRVRELISAQNRFAVAPCICRLHAKMEGNGCDAIEEACLIFGDWADYYVRGGMGRYIDRTEVLEILARADADNLVLQPTNSRDIAAICCCCGCCCGILNSMQRHPKPSSIVSSSFIVTFEPEKCIGCMVCLDRCQMQAFTGGDDAVILNTDRCIGCGLCVTTCPSGALTLLRKPGSSEIEIPADMETTWRRISQDRADSR